MRILIVSLMFLIGFVFAQKPIVSVSIPPQAYFVQQIANDLVKIQIIIPPNTDEHNFELKPQTMQTLEQSDIYFTIGLELESLLLQKLQHLQKPKIIPTFTGLANLSSTDDHEHTHHSHEHHRDEHDFRDPHIWLDPMLVQKQAKIIAHALSESFPEHAAIFQKNLETFELQLTDIDKQIRSLFAHKKQNQFIVYHPSWGYFAQRYNLEQIPIEIEGKEPKPRDLQALITKIKKEKFKALFVQPGFPDSLAKTIAQQCNIEIISIDHLAYDWKKELLKTAQLIAQSLQ